MTTSQGEAPVRTRIVQIGNSRGVRIPKPILEQAGLLDEVDLSVEGDRLVIQPARAPRAGWAEAIALVPEVDGVVIGAGGMTRFDREEWSW